MKAIVSLTFHGSCAVFHMYVIHWLMFTLGLNILEMLSFFTVWTTVCHLLMFLALAVHDAGRIFNHCRDQALRYGDTFSRNVDFTINSEGFLGLFLHLAIVMSSFTQVVFWFLFYIDREMILPETVGMPSSLNHMLHTFPFCLALVAVYFFSCNFPNAKEERNCKAISRIGVKFVGCVAFVYLTLIWILFEIKGVWPYPFMFSFTRMDFLIFSLCTFLFSYFLCYVCSFIEVKIKKFKIV